MTYTEFRTQARERLNGVWSKAAILWLIFGALTGAIGAVPGAGGLVTLLIAGPIMLGLAQIFLRIDAGQDFVVEDIFKGFNEFSRSLTACLLITLYTLLWSLLLLVPGIMCAIGYSQTFYIMAENPQMTPTAAMEASKRMMEGYKTYYFMLMLSFIGWAFLCLFTFGIGYLWLLSYVEATRVLFYKRLISEPGTI
ncbi:MAG: DUF975 family protein [Candidatus Cloacimonadota bacterium]